MKNAVRGWGLILISVCLAATARAEVLQVDPADPVVNAVKKRTDTKYYWSDTAGKPLVFIGYYNFEVLGNQAYSTTDLGVWLDKLQDMGANYVRINPIVGLARAASVLDGTFDHTITVFNRPGPGTARSGGPNWSVTSINSSYLTRLKSFIDMARQRGIYVHLSLWDEITLKPTGSEQNLYDRSPYNPANNLNDSALPGMPTALGANGRTAFYSSLSNSTRLNTQKIYFDAVVNATKSYPNVFYEIGNEVTATATWEKFWYDRIRSLAPGRLITQDRQHQPTAVAGMDGFSRHRAEDGSKDDGATTSSLLADNATEANTLRGYGAMGINDSDRERFWGSKYRKAARAGIWHSLLNNTHFGLFTYEVLQSGGEVVVNSEFASAIKAARSFLQWANLPLAKMVPADSLKTSGTADVLADTASGGRHIVAYLRVGGTTQLNLPTGTTYRYWWLNPRTSELTLKGSLTGVSRSFTAPSSDDWVLYVAP